MSLSGLMAQVNVHGSVTNVNQEPLEGINILITAFFADSTVFYESLFTDPDGNYNTTLSGSPANTVGIVEVSMVDCWGTVVTQEYTVLNEPADVEADFVYCEEIILDSCVVFIVEEWVPGTVNSLLAWTPVSFDVEYMWSTGETTASIYPQSGGNYCVTVTFPWGCSATDCYDYIVDTSGFCFSYITTTPNNENTYDLEVFAQGTAPFTYLWDSGETTSALENVGPGIYCVEVTDANGCVYPTCAFIDDFSFCEVWIYCDPAGNLFAEGYGLKPLSYLWSTGETTQTILPDTNGLYCVTITDANLCTASSCYYYGPYQDSCYVWVNAERPDSSNTLALHAIGSSFGDSLVYVWNTGETGEIIYPSDPTLTYCVTMTDSDGCVATACYEPLNWCYTWINLEFTDTTTAVLSVFVDSLFGFGDPLDDSFIWSNGDTGQVITVHESGTYCVTATLWTGCVAEACVQVDFELLGTDCWAWVIQYPDTNGLWFAEASAWSFGGDFTYLWSTGDTSPVIQLDYPNQYACVTATNSFGCETVACIDTFFNPCQVYINITQPSNDLAILEAFALNNPAQNTQFLWSNGSTEPTISVDQEGTYCVTATGGGCISESCVDVFFWNFDSCGVWIYEESLPFGIQYTAQAWGTEPFTYLWSNGGSEQSQIIDFGLHDLCVTVTDATGCVSSFCNFPGNNEGINIISGHVFADSLVSLRGIVFAYSVDPNGGPYTLVDSAQILNGWYRFNPLPTGAYILKAEILPGTVGYTDYMPTYYRSSQSWEEADVHVLPNMLTVTTDIRMIKVDTTNGTGVIGGIVSDPQHIMASANVEVRGLAGLPGTSVLLKDAQGNPLNYTISLEDGSFRFSELPFGTYRISYDIPGLHSPDVWVTLTHDNPEKLQVTLLLEGTVDVETPVAIELELYPNPAKEFVTMKIPVKQTDLQMRIMDMQGRVVYSGSVKNENGIMSIDVDHYSPGLYHINLAGNNAIYIGRFVKQD